jgi:transcriptional activator of comK gene
VDVYYKEEMNTDLVIEQAVMDFHNKGVNLVIGHGSEYAEVFNRLADQYKDIHFISMNGNATMENTTSLNFNAHAMGFFAGMVAAEMSKTDRVGVLAAFEKQPEVQGFMEGAAYQNSKIDIEVQYVHDWDDEEKALALLDQMIKGGSDVFYPAGDGYNVPAIEKIKENGLYAIGFVSDQADLGESTVLTSTVQHVDDLYKLAAERFDQNKLESGNLFFDFQDDDVITMGTYSPLVPQSFQEEIETHIEHYKKTGELPGE